MALPDVDRLSTLSKERWTAFGAYLKSAGLTVDRVAPVHRAVQSIPVPLRRPIVRFHLRRITDRVSALLRAFFFDEPVERRELNDALGDWVQATIDAGLLVEREGGLVSPFVLNLYDDTLVLVDHLSHRADAAMGSGPTTVALTQAVMPTEKLGRVLDFGCGAGTTALCLAPHVEEAIGTDINPRAIALAEVNAALNGFRNVQFREGDMFAPVAGETFDLVVSQPPFVAMPEGADAATYLYGGRRGDEFPLRVLAELPPLLSPRGRAVVFVEWPEVEGDPIERRVRSVVPSDLDLVMLQAPPTDLDVYCAWYGANDHPGLGPDYERMVERKREHLERTGIATLRQTFNVVERAPSGRGVTAVVPIRPLSSVRLGSRRIGRIVEAQRLLAAGDDALLAATLRVPKRTTFVREYGEPNPEAAPTHTSAQLPDTALAPPVGLNEEAFTLVALIHACDNVRAACELMERTLGTDPEFARKKVLPHAREALARGLLEVAPHAKLGA